VGSISSFDRGHVKYLCCLFANTSVAAGDDSDFPGQVRNVVEGELGLWGEVTFDKNRIERLHQDTKGREEAGARHIRYSLGAGGTEEVFIYKERDGRPTVGRVAKRTSI